jgi:hypothetical protein
VDNDSDPRPLVIIDAANTVGSVPDGWWRDRHGATVRLRDALAPLAGLGLPATAPGVPCWAAVPPLDLVLVVEGAARGVPPVPGVRVEAAPGSGDDLIAGLAADAGAEGGRRCLVITADRELRARVTAHGALVAGPRVVRPATG